MFIAFEGLSGVGKSSLAKAFADRHGYQLPSLRVESFASALLSVEDDPRKLEVRHSLYLGLWLNQLVTVTELLNRGAQVVVDSWIYRTSATHEVLGSSLSWRVHAEIPKPSHTFLITIPEDLRQERLRKRASLMSLWKARCEQYAAPILDWYRSNIPGLIEIDNSRSLRDSIANIEAHLGELNAHG